MSSDSELHEWKEEKERRMTGKVYEEREREK